MSDITPTEAVAAALALDFGGFYDEALNGWVTSEADGSTVKVKVAHHDDAGEEVTENARHFRATVVEALPPADNLLGTVRRKPNGCVLAVLWPSPPSPDRWMVTDMWGSCGYETDEAVKDWPVVGAVPFSPAAGVPLKAPEGTQTGGASDA